MLIETVQKVFIPEKKFEGLKESSIGSYHTLFKHWNIWLNQRGIEQLEDITSRTMKQYLIECVDSENKPKTVNDFN